MTLAVIDYGASNLQSVCNALEKLGQSFEVVSDPKALSSFEKIILPGVGAAKPAMEKLASSGFDKVLPRVKVPVLGICLGLQLLAESSEEEDTPCLSIVPGKVRRFPKGLKIPQIGWNRVEWMNCSSYATSNMSNSNRGSATTRKNGNRLTDGVPNQSYFYFVNSYYLEAPERMNMGKTLYGIAFSSAIHKENFYGVQFHPEKSGEPGLRLLRNFCERV